MYTPLIAAISFVLGAASAAALEPDQVRKKVRPLVKNTLKAGISASREVRRRATRLVEDLDDLVAEVMAEDSTQGSEAEQGSTPPEHK